MFVRDIRLDLVSGRDLGLIFSTESVHKISPFFDSPDNGRRPSSFELCFTEILQHVPELKLVHLGHAFAFDNGIIWLG
jgi:hypothetical protein